MQDSSEIFVEKEDAYVALPTTEDEVIFAISVKTGEPKAPHLLYDGDEHALLYRDENDVVLLDYLNSEVQRMLQGAQKIYVAEIDYKEKQLIRDYTVPVEKVSTYPINLAPYFD